jgi:hypothetical protein
VSSLRRLRAAAIAGYARAQTADPDEIAQARRRGGAVRGAQLRGDSAWGRRMAEARRLKRYGATMPSAHARIDALERRVERLEEATPT